ncbi:hypothetical protein, partial [Xanthomonas phaseoli]|uniref:hypothetical protein n=1 Tax=Xanthomonas phaseoli TaxID=1985254 RepID=UPI001EE6874C
MAAAPSRLNKRVPFLFRVISSMKLLTAAIGVVCLSLFAQAGAVTFATGDTRAVAQPAIPATCQP